MTALLASEDLCFRYGRLKQTSVFDRLKLDVRGRSVGILGPNGAGKSTLLSLVTGARSPAGGDLTVAGLRVGDSGDRRELKRRLGYVPQSMSIHAGYTVAEFLRYICWLRRIPPAETADAIERALRATTLCSYRDARIRTLSGGTRQRAKLAQALLGQPRLIVVDEPTVGLDPEQRAEFLDVVISVRETAPVLLATHLVEDVARVCETVLVIDRGRAIFQGPVHDLAGGAPGESVDGRALERGYRDAIKRAQVGA